MHKIIEKHYPRKMFGSGSQIILNLRTSFSDNCVSTVQPKYLPQHLFPLAKIVFIPTKRKKRKKIELKARGVQLRMQHYA